MAEAAKTKRKNELAAKIVIKTKDKELIENIINQKISNLINKELSK